MVLGLNTAAIALDLSNGINNALPGVKANIHAHLYKSLGLSFAGADIWAPPVQECRPTSFSVDPVAPGGVLPRPRGRTGVGAVSVGPDARRFRLLGDGRR